MTAEQTRQAASAGDSRDAGHPQRWWILAVLSLSLVLTVANNSGVNVALPTLVREIDATQTQLQWIIDIYVLVAGLVLFAGALADRYGRRRALLAGLVVFAATASTAAFAATPEQVIAARAGMGLGAAFIVPATLSILTSVFPADERGRAIAIWAGFAGAGSAIGPVGVGLLLEHYWWGSVFLVNLPIIGVALLGGVVLIPASRDPDGRPFDIGGAVLSIVALGGLLFAIIEGPRRGWTDLLTTAGVVAAAVGALCFAVWERRTDDPMLDLSWFRERRLAIGAATMTVAFLAAIALFFTLTQYLQFVLGYSALQAGLAQLPVAVAMITVSNVTDRLAQHHGHRAVITVGLAAIAGAIGYIAAVAGTATSYWVLLPGLALAGAGLALSTATSTGLIMAATPTNRSGVGSAINDTTREVGGALGVAVLGSVLVAVYRSGLPTGLLDAGQLEMAGSSVGAALELARSDPSLTGLATTARDAFTSAFRVALATGAVIAGLTAVLVSRPHRHQSEAP